MAQNISTRFFRTRIVISIISLVVIILSFFWFAQTNNQRIVNQNTEYIISSAQQTAKRIDNLFNTAQNNIAIIAKAYDYAILLNPDIVPPGTDRLSNIAEDSIFTYAAFVDLDGNILGGRGHTTYSIDREFYTKGMKGETGICFVPMSEDDKVDAYALAYAPVHYPNGEVAGVLIGGFSPEQLSEELYTTVFGAQTGTYLCDSEGYILSRSSTFNGTTRNNVMDFYDSEKNSETIETIDEAFANLDDVSFTYKTGDNETGIAYAMKLPSYDLELMRTFPAQITADMSKYANEIGYTFLFIVAGILILFLAVIVFQEYRGRKTLEKDKEKLSYVVESVATLYKRFIILNFDTDMYEYIREDAKDNLEIEATGKYDAFRKFWLSKIVDEDDRKQFEEICEPKVLTHLLETKPDHRTQYECRVYDEKGKTRWLQLSLLSLSSDNKNKINEILLCISDVTEIKAKEEYHRQALQQAFDAAELANRAKTDFLNNMSHDIRTPMNSITGLTAIASMYIDDKERVKECLDKISLSSKHLLGLINEVLDMAKIESGTISLTEESFTLPEIVENLVTLINPQVQTKHLNMKIDIAGIKHENIMGDPMRLQQIFINIMGNSVKFTDPGGTIGMSIREKPAKVPGTSYYTFTFTDTGCGMTPEFVDKIFEPFTRANDTRTTRTEGTGLGMPIVKSIVDLMGGDINIESELGKGTTFIIDLPMKTLDTAVEDLEKIKGLDVLVVDNEQTACEAACLLVEEIGMNSEYVLSGEEAVEKVREKHGTRGEKQYDAIILDWNMPGMSGVEAAEKIRAITGERLPIIILSAYDWSTIEQEAREKGVNAFLSKPLFRSRLVHVMIELVTNEKIDQDDMYDVIKQKDYSGHKVLLVEDNPISQGIAKDILETMKLNVDVADDGQQACLTLENSEPHTYDLVFMDIQMPIMNGYEATKNIREIGKTDRPDLSEIPIIALTADAFLEDINNANNAGMNDHISKPIEFDRLIETLNKYLD